MATVAPGANPHISTVCVCPGARVPLCCTPTVLAPPVVVDGEGAADVVGPEGDVVVEPLTVVVDVDATVVDVVVVVPQL
jgi:hypothetical protein